MKTVCLFIPHLAIGGSELQLSVLARSLAAEEFRPIVAAMESAHGVAEDLRRAGIEVHVLPRRGRNGLDTILALARLVRRERVSLVHAWLWSGNWRAAVGRFRTPRIPVVLSIRSLEEDLGWPHQAAYRALSPLVDAIIVNSQAVLERSAARTGLPRRMYRLVPNAVEVGRLEEEAGAPTPGLPPFDGSPVAGYVGGLHPRKRVEALVAIAPRVLARCPRARFLVLGDGPARDSLLAASRRAGVESRFHLAGYQSRVAPWIRRMSVLVHPSRNEGCSNAILEAQALGVPVVAYAVSGNLEAVRDGQTGYLVPDGDEAALGDRVAELLADPSAARRMGERAREFIKEVFPPEAMVRRTAQIYREMTLRKCNPPSSPA